MHRFVFLLLLPVNQVEGFAAVGVGVQKQQSHPGIFLENEDCGV